jgi:hypothetical protein
VATANGGPASAPGAPSWAALDGPLLLQARSDDPTTRAAMRLAFTLGDRACHRRGDGRTSNFAWVLFFRSKLCRPCVGPTPEPGSARP